MWNESMIFLNSFFAVPPIEDGQLDVIHKYKMAKKVDITIRITHVMLSFMRPLFSIRAYSSNYLKIMKRLSGFSYNSIILNTAQRELTASLFSRSGVCG